MNALVVLVLVSGAFGLGFWLGRRAVHVRRRATRGTVTGLTPRAARPMLRVIAGGRLRRSADG
jgi:hypothetical protein